MKSSTLCTWSTALLVGVACAGGQTQPAARPPGGPTSQLSLAAPSAAARGAAGGGIPDPEDTRGYQLPTPGLAAVPGASPVRALAPVATETQFARLSHSQYQHTMRDLFGLDEPLDVTFAPDARNNFGFDTSNALRVDARLGPQYRAMAESMAERAIREAALYARLVTCETPSPDCRDHFLRSFGERAFRRPLTDDDIASFREVFEAGPSLAPSGNAFKEGVRLTLEAMLQSPEFLYRQQLGRGQSTDDEVRLGDFEMASRLSYFLYDSMPDDELFSAARGGRLRTRAQVEWEVRRMLMQPRVLRKLVAFHEQAWHLERFARISPDTNRYPSVPKGLVSRVRQASRLFVQDILQTGGGLEELLTAPYAYVDQGLAPLYGVDRPDAGFARVDFANGERQGLLMQVGYLASNAYSIRTDPIHRGLFVIRDVLCRTIPDPPPGATELAPPPTTEPVITTRDEVSLVTGQSFCPTCHREINAPGFAFEGFDAVGQIRATDNGSAVNSSGQMVLDGEVVSFQGAAELVTLLAKSREAHRCYASRWLEFAYGRPLSAADAGTLQALSANSLPIADIIVAIVTSPAFLSPPVGASNQTGVQ